MQWESDTEWSWWHSCFRGVISRMQHKIKFVVGFVCLLLMDSWIGWRMICWVFHHNLLQSFKPEVYETRFALAVSYKATKKKETFQWFMLLMSVWFIHSEWICEFSFSSWCRNWNDEHRIFSRGETSLINYRELFSSGMSIYLLDSGITIHQSCFWQIALKLFFHHFLDSSMRNHLIKIRVKLKNCLHCVWLAWVEGSIDMDIEGWVVSLQVMWSILKPVRSFNQAFDVIW